MSAAINTDFVNVEDFVTVEDPDIEVEDTHPWLGQTLTDVTNNQETDLVLRNEPRHTAIAHNLTFDTVAVPGEPNEGYNIATVSNFLATNSEYLEGLIEQSVGMIDDRYIIRASVSFNTQSLVVDDDTIVQVIDREGYGGSRTTIYDRARAADEILQAIFDSMTDVSDEIEVKAEESGYVFVGFTGLSINIVASNPVMGNEYFPIPNDYLSNKSTINLETVGNKCLLHCISTILLSVNHMGFADRVKVKGKNIREIWKLNKHVNSLVNKEHQALIKMFTLYKMNKKTLNNMTDAREMVKYIEDSINEIVDAWRERRKKFLECHKNLAHVNSFLSSSERRKFRRERNFYKTRGYTEYPKVAIELWRKNPNLKSNKGLICYHQSDLHSNNELRIDLALVTEHEWSDDPAIDLDEQRSHFVIINNLGALLQRNTSGDTDRVGIYRCCRKVVKFNNKDYIGGGTMSEYATSSSHYCSLNDDRMMKDELEVAYVQGRDREVLLDERTQDSIIEHMNKDTTDPETWRYHAWRRKGAKDVEENKTVKLFQHGTVREVKGTKMKTYKNGETKEVPSKYEPLKVPVRYEYVFNKQQSRNPHPLVCYWDLETSQSGRGLLSGFRGSSTTTTFKAVPYDSIVEFRFKPCQEWFNDVVLRPVQLQSYSRYVGPDPHEVISEILMYILKVQSSFREAIRRGNVPLSHLNTRTIRDASERFLELTADVDVVRCETCKEEQLTSEGISVGGEEYSEYGLVIDHDHFFNDFDRTVNDPCQMGAVRGFVCGSCNAKMEISTNVICLAYNGSNFDNHFIGQYFDAQLLARKLLDESHRLNHDSTRNPIFLVLNPNTIVKQLYEARESSIYYAGLKAKSWNVNGVVEVIDGAEGEMNKLAVDIQKLEKKKADPAIIKMLKEEFESREMKLFHRADGVTENSEYWDELAGYYIHYWTRRLNKIRSRYGLADDIDVSATCEDAVKIVKSMILGRRGYNEDLHFRVLVHALNDRKNLTGGSGHKFKSMTYCGGLIFRDAMAFFGPGTPLSTAYGAFVKEKLETMTKEEFIERHLPGFYDRVSKEFPKLSRESQTELALSKGIFPYFLVKEYDDLIEKRDFPPHSEFRKVSKKDYEFVRGIYEEAGMESLYDLSTAYVHMDGLSLAAIVENYRDICLESDGLDPVHYFGIPSYGQACELKQNLESYPPITLEQCRELIRDYPCPYERRNAYIKMSNRRFSLISDEEREFIESSTFGGVSSPLEKRHTKTDDDGIIIALDITSMYPAQMLKEVPKSPITGVIETDTADGLDLTLNSGEGQYIFQYSVRPPKSINESIEYYSSFEGTEAVVDKLEEIKDKLDKNYDGDWWEWQAKYPLLIRRKTVTIEDLKLSEYNMEFAETKCRTKKKRGHECPSNDCDMEFISPPTDKICLSLESQDDCTTACQYLNSLIYSGYIVEIKKYMEFDTGALYLEFIEKTFANRAKNKKLKREIAQLIDKLKMNAQYGKSIENHMNYNKLVSIISILNQRDIKRAIERQSSIRYIHPTEVINDNTILINMYETSIKYKSTPHTGQSILASAKVRMAEVVNDITLLFRKDETTTLYTDTDSIYIKVPRDFLTRMLESGLAEKFLDMASFVNGSPEKNNLHIVGFDEPNMDLEELRKMNAGVLGYLTLDGMYDEMIVVKSKVYAVRKYEGSFDPTREHEIDIKYKGGFLDDGTRIEYSNTRGNQREVKLKSKTSHHMTIFNMYRNAVFNPGFKSSIRNSRLREKSSAVFGIEQTKGYINGKNDKQIMLDSVNSRPYGWINKEDR